MSHIPSFICYCDIWLCGEDAFVGITQIEVTHKVSFYTDYLLFVSNRITDWPVVLNILELHGKLYGKLYLLCDLHLV